MKNKKNLVFIWLSVF